MLPTPLGKSRKLGVCPSAEITLLPGLLHCSETMPGCGALWASCFTDSTWEARPRHSLLSGPSISLEVLSPTQRKEWMPCPFHIALSLSLGRVFTFSLLACWGGRISYAFQDPSSWTKNQSDRRQVNRRKSNLVSDIWEIRTDMAVR